MTFTLYIYYMNRSERYQFCWSTLVNAYRFKGIELSNTEISWILLILEWFDKVDEFLDNKPAQEAIKYQQQIVSLLEIGHEIWVNIPDQIRRTCLAIREYFLKNDELSYEVFIRLVKTSFRVSNILRQTKDQDDILRYSLIEWRLCGSLVFSGLKTKAWIKLLRQFGAVGNIADDIIDQKRDYLAWEKCISPSISFYRDWLIYMIREMNKHDRILLKFLLSSHSAQIWKKFLTKEIGWWALETIKLKPHPIG